MLLYVLDSNFLRSEGLRDYLARNSGNCVLVPPDVFYETHRGNAEIGVPASFAILREFPRQVFIARDLSTCLEFFRVNQWRQLVDWPTSELFANNVKYLKIDGRLPEYLRNALRDAGEAMNSNDQNRIARGIDLPPAFSEFRKNFTKEELESLRRNDYHSDGQLQLKLVSLAHALFRAMQDVRPVRPIDDRDVVYTFTYRLCLGLVLLFIRYHQLGISCASGSKALNDLADIHVVAYATFTHGLMSMDKQMVSIFAEIRSALVWLGARMPQDEFL